MGVDAEMLVIPEAPVTDEDLKHASYIFGSAFHEWLMIGHEEEIYHRPIYRANNDDFYGDEVIPPNALRVPLGGRYYGKDYARGPLLIYIGMAELLEVLFPDCKLLYYGDSGGYESAEEFNREYRQDLLKFFAKSGRDSYNRFFDRENDGPLCPVCNVKMIRNGWGLNYKLFTCAGCGWIHREKDGVVTKGFSVKGF